MKRSYVLYTTLCAVVVGVILCYIFVFSDEDIQRQIASTFEKIDIQTSHQTASLPPVEAAQDDEDIDTTDALEQINQIDEVYYSDTIGAYLVLTEQAEFFEVSGNGTRVNSMLQLENTGKARLDDFIGLRMIEEDLVYAVTANGTLITIEREEGRWVERPRKQINGLVSEDRIFGLGYDRESNRLFMMNRLADTPDLELLYIEEREIEPDIPADEKSSEETDAETGTENTEKPSDDTATESVSTNDNTATETAVSEDVPDNGQDTPEEEVEEKEPETEWTLDSRQALSADGMSASIQQKFERFEGVGLVERQGRIYVLDSEELVLYTVNPEEETINGQMVTPRVYDSTGMFLQDNEIFAIVHPEVFDLDAFVSVD
ncbi:hypothetical protein [Exiguobacterium qingdaonense]|uniref:hypothetical protein n=1 Tax=Exiguobacterium qingdaonense TaxID=2751251 RepID=UPI001F0A0F7B|nr:hypothetical protein [Exiguobacterium qingdaonense]